MSIDRIRQLFSDSIEVKRRVLEGDCLDVLVAMGKEIVASIENNGKLMLCGNGGSAADAQHLAAELLIRLRPQNNRKGIPAIALAQDTSTLTACGNDFGYDQLYERMVHTLGKPGDVLIVITTSGNSNNILKALSVARKNGIAAFGFLGAGGGEALKYCDKAFVVPDDNTGRIQETHITAGHALMEYVEDSLINSGFINFQDK